MTAKALKSVLQLVLALIGTWGSAGVVPVQQIYAAEIGAKIPNFQLSTSSGEAWSLRSYSGKVVAFVFWSYKCPISLSYDGRLEELRSRYAGKEVVVVGIASGSNETPDEIRANVANRKITIPILLDSEGNVAEKIGASHAPSVFIIDGDGILRYKGALDNNKKAGEREHIAYAEDALDSILSGQKVHVTETRPFGCIIRQGRAGTIIK